MTLRFGLKEAAIQKICGVFARYPQIEKAVIYGSRAKGNYKNGSDIDLTTHGKDLTLDILLTYKAAYCKGAEKCTPIAR